MDDLVECGDHDEESLLIFQRIQQILEVSTLSDLVTADGLRIDSRIMNGQKLDRDNQYDWPRVQPIRRSSDDWDLWRSALRALYLHPLADPSDLRLRAPFRLGPFHEANDTEWRWWYSPLQQQLFQRLPNSWKVWTVRTTT